MLLLDMHGKDRKEGKERLGLEFGTDITYSQLAPKVLRAQNIMQSLLQLPTSSAGLLRREAVRPKTAVRDFCEHSLLGFIVFKEEDCSEKKKIGN